MKMYDADNPRWGQRQYDLILDAVENELVTSIASLEKARAMLHADAHCIYPDESLAASEYQQDLEAILASFCRRRQDGNGYDQPERVEEILERHMRKMRHE